MAKRYSRQEFLDRLRNEIKRGKPLVMTGAGNGIAAKFIEQGGVDIIGIYNTGYFRMQGYGSLAGMLPMADANELVFQSARKEILPFGALGASGRWLLVLTTLLVFLQLMIGATMRHQHAGLAIPDFPLAYGKLWPAMDSDAIATYNARRIETTAANPITAAQVGLQMAHRLLALMILVSVGTVAWRTRRTQQEIGLWLRRLASLWLGLILFQIVLGAWTVWSGKAADVATAHVLVGALSLVTGTLGCIIAFRRSAGPVEATALAAASFDDARGNSFPGNPAAVLNQT